MIRNDLLLLILLAFIAPSEIMAQNPPASSKKEPLIKIPPSPTPRPGGKNKPPRMPQKAYTQGEFILNWTYQDVPFKFRLLRVPFALRNRVGETKNVSDLAELQISSEIFDGKVSVTNGRPTVLALVAQNTTDKPISFVVSPHHTHPVEATIGFKFNCLCYGHAYTAAPGQYWYRIIELVPADYNTTQPITLVHNVVRVQPPDSNK